MSNVEAIFLFANATSKHLSLSIFNSFQKITPFQFSLKDNPQAYTGYSWQAGDDNTELTDRERIRMKRKLFSGLRNLAGNNSITYFLQDSQYFPRVRSRDVVKGFFRQLDAIQGRGGVYYASTVLTFETVNGAIEMGEKFVQKYF